MLIIVVIITLLDNSKNRFLVLGKEPTEGINGSVGTAKKIKLVLNLVKQIQNFA